MRPNEMSDFISKVLLEIFEGLNKSGAALRPLEGAKIYVEFTLSVALDDNHCGCPVRFTVPVIFQHGEEGK